MRRPTLLLVAIGLVVAACGSDSDSQEAATTAAPATTAAAVTTTAVAATTEGTEAPATTTTAPPETTTTTEAPGEALLGGLPPVVLTSAPSGGGIRPELSWETFTGADHYAVYLYTPTGRIYWAWRGRETSVPVGGRPVLPDNASGPSVVEGMTWAVVAYDAALQPIGSSVVAPISP